MISYLLVRGICITPVLGLLVVEPSWGQTSSSQAQQAKKLVDQGVQQSQQGQHQQAIQTFHSLPRY